MYNIAAEFGGRVEGHGEAALEDVPLHLLEELVPTGGNTRVKDTYNTLLSICSLRNFALLCLLMSVFSCICNMCWEKGRKYTLHYAYGSFLQMYVT